MTITSFLVLVVALSAAQLRGEGPQRVRPSEFKGLPAEFQRQLAEAKCMVPQASFGASQPNNVVSGEFAAPGQKDWAVLCSRGGSSSILLYWGGPAKCESSFRTLPDETFMQKGESDAAEYSRLLVVPDRTELAKRLREQKPGFTPRHDALGDAFIGKAATVLYCGGRHWTVVHEDD